MKKIFIVLLAMVLAIGMLLPAAAVMAVPPLRLGPGTIDVGNIPAGGVTGGDNDFCSTNPEEWDEWHFVIVDLDPTTSAPASITAVFQTAGSVSVPWEKTTGGTAHYRLEGQYLTDTLLSASAVLVDATCSNFNLSHAPCSDDGGGGPSEIPEVGGEIYPINKAMMLTPAIILAIALLSGTGIFIWRRQTQR